ncbi:phosphoglycerate mutase [Agrobacterium sp. ATCC 31749]|uniref:histidine phosphatase family protein n=1 Tax=unclassified Agrobacterium TaxID=2632611 RepID=UPI00020DBC02|nr:MULTISPECIES: histidine phosphatase family protein [unclassified Agrobacterium]EGL62149.1 phosphoglycerate mutase [Agrobacterium sp. ATCC 31749]QKX00376.1 histidine phosphatase family protein [Agrobacterium sp. CGMCC 11546]
MLYLVRHGQTEFNAVGRWQGQCDSPLTDVGRAQAAHVASILKSQGLNQTATIVSSPLGRAIQTAEIIASTLGVDDPLTVDARLKEVGMGSWDGLTDTEIEAEWPNVRDGLGHNEWFFHSSDGERYDEMLDRVQAALSELMHDLRVPKVVVCHGVTSRIVRGIHLGLSKNEILDLEVPQNAAFRLSRAGSIERLS